MPTPQDVNSLLIFRLGSVGDTVVALPCFRLIKKAFPNAKKYVLTNIPVNEKACALESILKNTELVDTYLEYPSQSSLLKKIISLRKTIKQNHFKTMVYFHQNRHLLQAWRDFLFFKFCGVKKIIGLPLYRHGFQYRYDKKRKCYESEHKRLARQLKQLGEIDWTDPNILDLALTTDELAQASAVIPDTMINHPFIVCSIGTKLAMKDWGQENWQKLISQLSKRYTGYGVVCIGVQNEYERSKTLLDLWHGPTLNLCGKLSVRQSAAILHFSRLFVGHDSGPMHLASSVGTPCVAIFSRHAKPGCWFPFGEQHQVIYPKKTSILSITVDEVLEKIFAIASPTKV